MNIPLKFLLLFVVIFSLSSCGNRVDRAISEIEQSQYSMAVNAFLWRASLDTLMFMPIDKSDSIGGIISTNWYSGEGITNGILVENQEELTPSNYPSKLRCVFDCVSKATIEIGRAHV